MPSLRLSNPFRRNADRPSLKERAAALKATAARVMKRKPELRPVADRVREMAPYYEGFVPYPAAAPASLLRIEAAIPLEAERLLELACQEYERLYPYQSVGKDDAGRQAVADRLRRDLRIAELEAVIDPPTKTDAVSHDPIFGVLAASRKAEDAMRAFGEETIGATIGEDGFATEAELVAEQGRTLDIALTTVPTTLAGARALVDYFRWQASLRGFQDWEHPKNDEWFFGPMLKALATAIMALPAPSAPPAHDLSGCALAQLARLHEAVLGCWQHVGAHTQVPCFWESDGGNLNPAGRILEAEEARLDALMSAINAEAARRTPVDGHDRDERLSALLRHELLCSGKIEDRALLTEAVAAWGA